MEEKRVSMGRFMDGLRSKPKFEESYEQVEVVGVGAFAVAVKVAAPLRPTRNWQVLKMCNYDNAFQPVLEAINSYSISRMRDNDAFIRERTQEYYHTDSRLQVSVHDVPHEIMSCIKAADDGFLSRLRDGSVVVHAFEPMDRDFKPLLSTLQRALDARGRRSDVLVVNQEPDTFEISDTHLRHALLQFLMLMCRIQLHDPRMRHNDCVPNLFFKIGAPREVVFVNNKGVPLKFTSPVYIKLIDFGHSFTSMFNGEMRNITGEEHAFWATPSMLANAMSTAPFPEHDAFTLFYTLFRLIEDKKATAFAGTAAVIRRVCAGGFLEQGYSFDASTQTEPLGFGTNSSVFNSRVSTFPKDVLVPIIEARGLKGNVIANLIRAIYASDADAVNRLIPQTDIAGMLSDLFSTIANNPSAAQGVFQQQNAAGVYMKTLEKAIMEPSFLS